MEPIRRIVSALEPTEAKSSSTVRKEMEAIIEWLRRTYDRDTDVAMVKNLTSYTKGFWKGLFSCYDHGHLPRTNNDHERFFRQTKTRHRRMTGRRSWNEYILRNGEYVVLVDDALQQEDLTNRLSLVSYENYKEQKKRWNNRLNESVLRRRFRKDPLAYLQKLENKHSVLVIPL
ncbi:IS66 family transposase [Paenibacillus cremeus]|uniref:Transposase n=1 Tax=Paenibacillus cremeus TaxID=2163881 RepID=A0A559JAY6_9BACL|nr:transposase [Paenibacillus cremeus]TVX97050.1 transposase [Paenibacillus cremeus]